MESNAKHYSATVNVRFFIPATLDGLMDPALVLRLMLQDINGNVPVMDGFGIDSEPVELTDAEAQAWADQAIAEDRQVRLDQGCGQCPACLAAKAEATADGTAEDVAIETARGWASI